MDAFLEEQLKRIQELTRRMSSFERRSAELSGELERDRQSFRQSPLHDVRDFRTYSSIQREQPRATAEDRPRRTRRARKRRSGSK